jgi:ribosomal-protein-alanine N-acetyltransferase
MAGQILFRNMTRADLPAVVSNEDSAYFRPWTLGVFSDCLDANYGCWVMEREHDVLGHGILNVAAGECHLLNVCVRAENQRSGLGRRMVEHLLVQAAKQEAERIYLEVRPSNLIAYKLYMSMGFTEVGVRKGYYPAESGREDALVLTRELS